MNINIRDIFFNFTVYASFKHTFSVAVMLNFSFLEFFVFFGSFCFFCLPFCHPIGGRDSLKKRKIHQEVIYDGIPCTIPKEKISRFRQNLVPGGSWLRVSWWAFYAAFYSFPPPATSGVASPLSGLVILSTASGWSLGLILALPHFVGYPGWSILLGKRWHSHAAYTSRPRGLKIVMKSGDLISGDRTRDSIVNDIVVTNRPRWLYKALDPESVDRIVTTVTHHNNITTITHHNVNSDNGDAPPEAAGGGES